MSPPLPARHKPSQKHPGQANPSKEATGISLLLANSSLLRGWEMRPQTANRSVPPTEGTQESSAPGDTLNLSPEGFLQCQISSRTLPGTSSKSQMKNTPKIRSGKAFLQPREAQNFPPRAKIAAPVSPSQPKRRVQTQAGLGMCCWRTGESEQGQWWGKSPRLLHPTGCTTGAGQQSTEVTGELSSSRQPISGTADPPGCGRSSPPRPRRPRGAG